MAEESAAGGRASGMGESLAGDTRNSGPESGYSMEFEGEASHSLATPSR